MNDGQEGGREEKPEKPQLGTACGVTGESSVTVLRGDQLNEKVQTSKQSPYRPPSLGMGA
uniref:Uncharacterized protein n=1 Tax=Ursus maritimus TaxID=29073 RepID=A0A452TZZ3_URSMA